MAIGLSSNFNDPRFQRAVLAEAASRPFAALPTTGAATSAFVGQDLGTRLAFDRIGLAGMRARNALRHSGFELDLRREALKERKKQLLPTMLIQGGLGLYSLLEGRRGARQSRERSALTRQLLELQIAAERRKAAASRRGL